MVCEGTSRKRIRLEIQAMSEYAELERQHDSTYAEFKVIRADSQILWKIKSHIDTARKNIEPVQITTPTQKQKQEI